MTVVENQARANFEEALSDFSQRWPKEKTEIDIARTLADDKTSESDKRRALVEEILLRWTIKTLDDTGEMLYYDDGIYRYGAESRIRAELQQLGGCEITNHMRSEVLETIRTMTYVSRDEFDRDPFIVNVLNGLVDLRSGAFKQHAREHLSLIQLPIKYDPSATCKAIIEFLYNVVQEPTDVPLVLEFLAYCMIDEKYLQKELIAVGPPDSGKSVFLHLTTAFLGRENVSNVTLQQLSTNRFALAQLHGKKANIYADISHVRLEDIERFKAIATADEVEAEKKGMQLFKFRPKAKQIYSANIPPKPPITVDDSYYRRWLIILFALRNIDYFTKKPLMKDPKIIEKLTTDEHLSGLFNLVLISARRLIEKQRFCRERSVEETRDLYDRLANPVKLWIENNCEGDSEACLDRDEGYKTYVKFCTERRITPLKKEWVGRELGNLGFVSEQRGTGKNKRWVWVGLKLLGTGIPPFSSTIENSILVQEKEALLVPSQKDAEHKEKPNSEVLKE